MEYTLAEAIKVRDYAALVVALHGRNYLPIFEAMEREVANLTSREDALARALRIAGSSPSAA